MIWPFDLVILVLLVIAAVIALRVKDLLAASIVFGVYSFLICLLWAEMEAVDVAFKDKKRWAKMAILNTARVGKFSSDRTISEYAEQIWKLKPVKIG